MANQKQYWQFEIFGSDADLIGFFGDAGVILPSGTTAERPASPSVGHMRLNTDTSLFEGFNGSWNSFGSGSVSTFDSLTDTPVSKTGAGNRVMIVNSAETELAYSSALSLENSGRLRVSSGYEALVDADTVITNKKYVDDNDALQLSLSGGLMTGGITMGGFSITGLPLTPSSGSEAASKNYVDQIASGIDFKESCHFGTVSTFTAIYDNGTAGLGATLTASAPGVLPPSVTDDHAHFVVGTRILVKDQTDPVENGIYEITDTGTGEEVTEIVTVADVANSLDGTYWTFNDGATSFYVWYDTPAGAGDPAPGGTGIMVSIPTTASAEAVKDATILAINASGALAVAYNDEVDTFYVVNDNVGTATDATAATSGFTVTVDIDGIAVGTVWILTRTTDADNSPTNEVSGGMFTFVEDGATLAGTGWVLVDPAGDAVIGTDDLVFTPISSGGGAFLPLAGGTMVGSIAMGSAGIQVIGDTATSTAPSYSFAGDLGTGLHQIGGAGTMSLVIGTAPIWNVSPTELAPAVTLSQDIGSSGLKVKNIYADHFLPNFGATGDPSYAFEGDATTGMYNDGAGGINFAVGGTTVLGIESDGTISVDTASYETLVIADNDVPNKKYVDDAIGGIATNAIVDADADTSVNVETTADDDFIRFNTGATPTNYPANVNTMTLASSGWTVALPAANVATAGGAPINLTAGDGNTTGDGGEFIINAGDGGNNGEGGGVLINSGTPSANNSGGIVEITTGDAPGFGNGGAINLKPGDSNGGGDGGVINLYGGYSTGGDGGEIQIFGGDTYGEDRYGGHVRIRGGSANYKSGGGYGGNVDIDGGTSTDGFGGRVRIIGGDGAQGGGNVFIESGGSQVAGGGYVKVSGNDAGGGDYAGFVTVYGGDANSSYAAGRVQIQGGTGFSSNGGGELQLYGGPGSPASGTHDTVGGAVTIKGGVGGFSSGDGGAVTITGGSANAGNGDGGKVLIQTGALSGTGADGAIEFLIGSTVAFEILGDTTWELAGAPGTSGDVLTSNGAGSAPTWTAPTVSTPYTEAFDDGDLTAGVIAITHSLGTQFNHVTVYDDSDIIVQPDSVTATSTSVATIDLTSFGTITGTWNVVVS